MQFLRIVKFDFINIIKNPTLIISNTVLPFILIGLMGFVTKSNYGAGSMSSYDFYGVTMIVLNSLLIIMTATNTFMEERVKRPNTRIIYAPISKAEIYMSKILSTYLVGILSFSIVILIGQYFFHINFGGNYLPYFMLLINILTLFGSCFGTMMCCILKDEEKASSIAQLPVFFSVFLGGAFFNMKGMGAVMTALSNISPVKWILECAFIVIYDNDVSMVFPVILSLILVSFICVAICQITFKPEEYTC